MGILSSNDKAPRTKKIILSPTKFNHSKLDKGHLKIIENNLPKKKMTAGEKISISNINGKFEVLKIEPKDSIPTEETEIQLKNDIIYEQGYEEFSIPENQLIELSEKPDIEDKSQLKNPRDFAKLVDESRNFVEYYEKEKLYVIGNYYFKFR